MPDGLFANPLHWVILIVVVLIIFGPGKLPGVGSALGKSLREFKKASQEDSPAAHPAGQGSPYTQALLSAAPGAVGERCAACGYENTDGARFCGSCGASLSVSVPESVVEQPAPEPVSATPVRCAECQTENPATNRFCAHCGKLIEPSVQRV